MDSVFLLPPDACSRFLRSAARAIGCTYICVWSYTPYPSNCLICLDGVWAGDADARRGLFDMHCTSFCSVESGFVPGLAYRAGLPHIELADSDLLNLASTPIQAQFYQEAAVKKAVFMGCKHGEIELGMSTPNVDINMQVLLQMMNEELAQVLQSTQSRPSSSSSSLLSLSASSPEQTSSRLPAMSGGSPSTISAMIAPHQMTMQDYGRQQNLQIPTPASDDAAMMRAVLTVISSPPSSSSPPNVSSLRAFRPYSASLAPNVEPRARIAGHKMIKTGIAILRSLRSIDMAVGSEGRAQLPRHPTSTQVHHMVAERRRREKLNDSFDALRMLLPPGSKKDKASVLCNTRDYLQRLKEQISQLEERNWMLKLQLSPEQDGAEEGGDGSSEGAAEVEIVAAPESTSRVRRMTLRVRVRVECDMKELMLRVLECLKGERVVDLVWVKANTFSAEMGVSARLNLGLQVEVGEWDGQSLKEAVARAVDGVVAAASGHEPVGRPVLAHQF